MPTIIPNDSRFQTELTNAGSKLVVVDFMASWCGPCHRVAPEFESLSRRYASVLFLKVDVDQCPETAASQGVTAMPTFIFYKNSSRLASVKGANIAEVEAKLKELTTASGDSQEPQGHVDLVSLVCKSACECLNDSDEHPFLNCLSKDGGYLESDCDAQLILSVGFNQSVKLHSLKIRAPQEGGSGPRTLRLFINQPRTLDFDQADQATPTQTLELTPSDLSGENPILLRFVKFQNVQNLQIFVRDNQGDCETTRIDHLAIIGSAIATAGTNMSDFKRVAGKKGESH